MAVHPFAQAVLAFLREESRLVILRDEIVQIVVGLQNDVAPAPAIAAGGAAFGPGRFTEESDTALPTVTGTRKNFDFVDEHADCGSIHCRFEERREHTIGGKNIFRQLTRRAAMALVIGIKLMHSSGGFRQIAERHHSAPGGQPVA